MFTSQANKELVWGLLKEQSKNGLTVYTIKKRVTPKQGRIVLFDGSLYHTAEQPLNNIRCIVNYNLG